MNAENLGASAPPANPWSIHMAEIEKIDQELTDVMTLRLRAMDEQFAKNYRARPGQFNMLYAPGCGEVAISLCSQPELNDQRMVHTIRVVGRVTEAIAQLRRGERIGIRGPFGSAWPMDLALQNDLLVVAGGIGLAPLRPVIEALTTGSMNGPRLIHLLYGSRTPDSLLYMSQLARWRQAGVRIQLTVDHADAEWNGRVGVVPLLVDRLRPLDPEQTVVFTCGPEVMMNYVVRSALNRGIAAEKIWVSLERNMQCAVGLCGHCQLGPAFVCRNGPVFRWDQISSYLQVRDL